MKWFFFKDCFNETSSYFFQWCCKLAKKLRIHNIEFSSNNRAIVVKFRHTIELGRSYYFPSFVESYEKKTINSVSRLFSSVICQFWLCQLRNFQKESLKELLRTPKNQFWQPGRKFSSQILKRNLKNSNDTFAENVPLDTLECDFDKTSWKFLDQSPTKTIIS